MISLGRALISRAMRARALIHRLLGLPAERMIAAGGVAELFGEIRQHFLEHARIHRRGGVVVHVNRQGQPVGAGAAFDEHLLRFIHIQSCPQYG